MSKEKYKMKGEVWLYPNSNGGAWHFVTLPKKEAGKIKEKFWEKRRGWGSFPVLVKVGKTSWKTSIFPNKQLNSYILPIKSEIREQEGIFEGDTVSYTLEVRL